MLLRALPISFVLLVAYVPLAEARGPTCGFDCTDGNYTACNDSFPTNMPGVANCSASLGSCTGEAFCASFGDNFQASAFPLQILRIYLVAASDNVMDAGMQFDLEIYQENGQPQPGAMIGAPINLSIPGSQTAATVVDFANLGLAPPTIPNAGRFRICFRKQFDMMHNICLDDTNPPSAYGRNWAHVRFALDPTNPCGSSIGSNMWYASNDIFPGIQGDFIIRPDLLPADPAGLPGGGSCPNPEDAGVRDSSINPVDAGEPDAEPEDAEPEDGGEAIDAEVDAGLAKDAGEEIEDAGETGEDAGQTGEDAGPSPAPEITAISPDEGRTDAPTAVTITGKNFAEGLTVKIGAILATDVEVGGTSTIQAVVPPGIAAGVYDVVVTNPDAQAAILPDAFTVRGMTTEAPPPDDGCGCTQAGRAERGAFWLIALILLVVGRRAKRAG